MCDRYQPFSVGNNDDLNNDMLVLYTVKKEFNILCTVFYRKSTTVRRKVVLVHV
jgi:hypothetical protein